MLARGHNISWRSWVPSNCPGCEKRTKGQGLCQECTLSLFGQEQKPRCVVCQLPLAAGICTSCSNHTVYYDKVISAFDYAGLGQQLVQDYKIRKRLSFARLLTDLLANAVYQSGVSTSQAIIVPVPAHFNSLLRRGFSPPSEIARLLAKQFNLHYRLNVLVRIQETAKQTSLSYQQRLLSPLSAYSCASSLVGKTVIVVDDVMTTGATLNAIASLLKENGAHTVYCWVLARTLR